jgi:hypothetical protein
MPVPAGYVGYTVLQQPVFKVCVSSYVPAASAPPQAPPPPQPPSVKQQFDRAAEWWSQSQPGGAPPPPAPLPPPGFGDGFSLFEFIVQLNNLNGGLPVPAGHVIVAKVSTDSTRVQPCGTPPRPRREETYYEKFGVPAIDFQIAITGCKSTYCFNRVMECAIMPDPIPATAIPANEHAVRFAPTVAQATAFAAAVTLRFTYSWEYDHCKQPPTNVLKFTAETLDPNQGGGVTWTLPGSPIAYTP